VVESYRYSGIYAGRILKGDKAGRFTRVPDAARSSGLAAESGHNSPPALQQGHPLT